MPTRSFQETTVGQARYLLRKYSSEGDALQLLKSLGQELTPRARGLEVEALLAMGHLSEAWGLWRELSQSRRLVYELAEFDEDEWRELCEELLSREHMPSLPVVSRATERALERGHFGLADQLVNVREKIERGLKDVEEGRVFTQ